MSFYNYLSPGVEKSMVCFDRGGYKVPKMHVGNLASCLVVVEEKKIKSIFSGFQELQIYWSNIHLLWYDVGNTSIKHNTKCYQINCYVMIVLNMKYWAGMSYWINFLDKSHRYVSTYDMSQITVLKSLTFQKHCNIKNYKH